jgi:DNA-binding transcriptional LysR family regulator
LNAEIGQRVDQKKLVLAYFHPQCRRTLLRKKFFGTHTSQYAARNCSRRVPQIERAGDLLQYPLIHFEWMNRDREAPTWPRWLATARSVDPGIPDTNKAWDLSFREELYAIDAVAAGQGIAICSDVVVGRELKSGALVRAHSLSLSRATASISCPYLITHNSRTSRLSPLG